MLDLLRLNKESFELYINKQISKRSRIEASIQRKTLEYDELEKHLLLFISFTLKLSVNQALQR